MRLVCWYGRTTAVRMLIFMWSVESGAKRKKIGDIGKKMIKYAPAT
jgi:hypothetical protein